MFMNTTLCFQDSILDLKMAKYKQTFRKMEAVKHSENCITQRKLRGKCTANLSSFSAEYFFVHYSISG